MGYKTGFARPGHNYPTHPLQDMYQFHWSMCNVPFDNDCYALPTLICLVSIVTVAIKL